jgi:hypothetical protein
VDVDGLNGNRGEHVPVNATDIVNNFTNITKTNISLLHQISEQKKTMTFVNGR